MKFYDSLLFLCLLLGEQSTSPSRIFFVNFLRAYPDSPCVYFSKTGNLAGALLRAPCRGIPSLWQISA